MAAAFVSEKVPTSSLRLAASGLTLVRPGTAMPILEDVDLRIETGECVLLVGTTGSGKSTLLRALSGLEGVAAKAGRVEASGSRALLLQHVETQLLCTTIGEEVGLGLRSRGIEGGARADRVRSALLAVDLAGSEEREIDSLSAGQKQRVALAALIALDPKLLLLDEPFACLDGLSRQQLVRVIGRLKRRGTAFLIAEHAPRELLEVVDRVLHIEARGLVPSKVDSARWPSEETLGDSELARPPESLAGLSRGERILLTGPNGSGKSACLRRLANESSEERTVALVIQEPRRSLFARTVREEVAFTIGRRRVEWDSEADACRRIDDLLERCGLAAFSNRSPRRLSFGQQHRLAIAAAISARPDFLLLDEPFAGLDPMARGELLHLIEEEQSVSGMVVLIASHDRTPLEAECTGVTSLPPRPLDAQRAGDSIGRALEFRPGKTAVHLAAAWKKLLLATLIGSSSLLLADEIGLPGLIGLLGVVGLGYAAASLTARDLWRDLRWLLLQGAIVLCLTLLLRGSTAFTEGVRTALQLILVFLPMALVIRTTETESMWASLEKALPERAGFALSVTLRFVPVFARELGELVAMQRLRGARLSMKELWRPTAWLDGLRCVALPMTVRVIEIAGEAADAATIRGVGSPRMGTNETGGTKERT